MDDGEDFKMAEVIPIVKDAVKEAKETKNKKKKKKKKPKKNNSKGAILGKFFFSSKFFCQSKLKDIPLSLN